MYDLAAALISLRPGASWSLIGENYTGLEWLDETQTKPTLEECESEMIRLKAEYDRCQYQRDRKLEYPSIADQLDMLYHQGYDGWRSQIDAVKSKYPKPE